MKRKSVIPEPPPSETITEEVEKRKSEWINYFINLSPRLNVTSRSSFQDEDEYDLFLENTNFFCAEILREKRDVDEPKILDWPNKKSIVFIVEINSSLVPDDRELKSENTFVFCYGDTAFGLDYFEEEDFYEEGGTSIYAFSLSNYAKEALSWKYISSLIKNRLKEIENSVPSFKKEK